MARKEYNQVRIVGGLFILAGLIIMLFSGQGAALISKAARSNPIEKDNTSVLVNGDEGEARIVVPQHGTRTAPKSAKGNDASSDPSFRGATESESESFMDFLGISAADLWLGLEIMLFFVGGVFIVLSTVKR